MRIFGIVWISLLWIATSFLEGPKFDKSPPNANDWPYDTVAVKLSRAAALDALKAATDNKPVPDRSSGEIIFALDSGLEEHQADLGKDYAPPARRYHSQPLSKRVPQSPDTEWILEDLSGQSWTWSDQWILRAYVESVNHRLPRPVIPALLDGMSQVIPAEFAKTDWYHWRIQRSPRKVVPFKAPE